MAPALAQDFDQQVRAAIDHLRMLFEIRLGVHHPQQLHDRFHVIKRPHCVADRPEDLHADLARIVIAPLD